MFLSQSLALFCITILKHLAICKVDFNITNSYDETVNQCLDNGYKDCTKNVDDFEKFIIDHWYESCLKTIQENL